MSFPIVWNSIWNNPGNRGQRIRRLFRAVLWQCDKRLCKQRRTVTLPNGAKMFAYPDCVVSSSVIYAEWPEFQEFQLIRRHLQRGDAVIDVGANVGHVLLLLSDVVGPESLIAFEPTPVSFSRLQENWSLNGWATSNLHHCAVGDDVGQLFIPDTSSPVTTNSLTLANGQEKRVMVQVKALDKMNDWLGTGPVGLLKIDVEGFEPRVFAGAIKFLKERRPRLIMFESLQGNIDAEIVRIFHATDYRVFQINESGAIEPDRTQAQNLFAAPREQFDQIMAGSKQ